MKYYHNFFSTGKKFSIYTIWRVKFFHCLHNLSSKCKNSALWAVNDIDITVCTFIGLISGRWRFVIYMKNIFLLWSIRVLLSVIFYYFGTFIVGGLRSYFFFFRWHYRYCRRWSRRWNFGVKWFKIRLLKNNFILSRVQGLYLKQLHYIYYWTTYSFGHGLTSLWGATPTGRGKRDRLVKNIDIDMEEYCLIPVKAITFYLLRDSWAIVFSVITTRDL